MSAQAIWSWVTGLHSLCHLPSLKTMIIARSAVPRRLLWEGWENLWFFHAFHSSSSSSCGKGGKVYGPFPRFPQVKATGPIPAAYVLQNLRHFHLCLTVCNPVPKGLESGKQNGSLICPIPDPFCTRNTTRACALWLWGIIGVIPRFSCWWDTKKIPAHVGWYVIPAFQVQGRVYSEWSAEALYRLTSANYIVATPHRGVRIRTRTAES